MTRFVPKATPPRLEEATAQWQTAWPIIAPNKIEPPGVAEGFVTVGCCQGRLNALAFAFSLNNIASDCPARGR